MSCYQSDRSPILRPLTLTSDGQIIEAVRIESIHEGKGRINLDAGKSQQAQLHFEGLIRKISIFTAKNIFQCILFQGTIRSNNNSTPFNGIAIQFPSPDIPHPLSTPSRRQAKRLPAETPKPVTIEADVDLSDWELLNDPSKTNDLVEACLKSAAATPSNDLPGEDWVCLSHEDFDKHTASQIKSLQEATKYLYNTDIIDHLLPKLNAIPHPETSLISFEMGNLVLKAPSGNNSFQIFLLLLIATYGLELAWTVIHRYQLINKTSYSLDDIKRALLGISVNVKKLDLQELLRNICNEKQGFSLHCSKLLTSEELGSLREAKKFDSLSTKQIGCLMKAFTSLPLASGPTQMLDALYEGKSWGLAIWQFDCFGHDTEVSKRLSFINTIDSNNLNLGISEHLCKHIAYLELKVGMIIPMLTESNTVIYYCMASKLDEKRDGVICSLLAPLNEAQKTYTKDDPLILYLNFRGTQWQPDRKDSYESLQRDLEYAGIGKDSFQRREKEMEAMVTAYLKKSTIPWVKLVINGHSLGDADTQRATRVFAKLLADPARPAELDKIVAIEAFFHNSPAPEASLNDNFTVDLKKLESRNCQVPFKLTLLLFATDPLQNAGDVYLGAQIKSPLLTKSAVLLKSKEWSYFAAHRLKAFVSPLDPCEITFIDESTPNNLLEKIYSRNYYWNTDSNTWIQMAGQRAQWYGGYALKPLKYTLSSTAYFGFSIIRSIVRTISGQRTEEACIKGWGPSRKITVHPSGY